MISAESKTEMMRRDERRERFRSDLAKCVADPEYRVVSPLPWTCSMVINNGPGAQFFDANGKPILSDLIRDPEDAALLLFNINLGRP